MDISLRCNSLKCRSQLADRAVVTTCSHIFCIPCSDNLGLSNSAGGTRICPACESHLSNPDDVVVSQLNPTEDYKTSVLSGLSPSIIMECAGRALAFYSYQTTQEIVYQEYLAKSLTEKCAALSNQRDKIIQEANGEIQSLRDKVSAFQLEQETLKQKNQDLFNAFREKSKTASHLQKLYQSLKAQAMAEQVANAASDDAEHALQTAQASNRYVDRIGTEIGTVRRNAGRYAQFPVDGQGAELVHSRQRSGSSGRGVNGTGVGRHSMVNGWGSHLREPRIYSSQSRLPPVSATPSQHRTRLPLPTPVHLHPDRAADYNFNPPPRVRPSSGMARQPLGNLAVNTLAGPTAGINGYSMSAGMKIGRPQGDGSLGRSMR